MSHHVIAQSARGGGKAYTLLTRLIAKRGIPTPERGYDSLGEVITDLTRAFNEADAEILRLNEEAGRHLAEIKLLQDQLAIAQAELERPGR